MNEKDFLITEEPSTFGGTKFVLKKYTGTDPKVIVPANVEEIGSLAFADNLYVKEVVLPESVEIIAGCAFSGCKNLRTVNIPERISVIGGSAFLECESLDGIVLPMRENIFIERTAFFGCTRLEEMWKSRGLCPLCGYQLKRQLFKRFCNRCRTRMK